MKRVLASVFVSMFVLMSILSGSAAQGQHQHGHGTPDADCDAPCMGTPMAMDHGDMDHGDMSMGAFYFTVTNTGDTADRLVKVESDVAMTIEVHDVIMKDNVMQMVHQEDGVEIPANGELVLKPGSYHIMLIGIHESLEPDTEFTATLFFENAGEVEITVPVSMAEPTEFADPVKVGDHLEVSKIWARQAPKVQGMGDATPMEMDHSSHGDMDHGDMDHGDMSMGAFYFTVTNTGDTADRLVKVESDVAMTIEVHDVIMKDNVMQMVHQEDGVEIPANGELVLKPGSYHIMLIGIHESLEPDTEFTATLFFEHAGEVEITVPVSMAEPTEFADPVKVGDTIEVSKIWARQAPKVEGMATPEN